MDEKRNNRSVERRLKEALKNDRARIQVGRISHFGLLEMSRQRIRTGVLESSSEICPHCGGTGHVRAPASVALHVLRAIEDLLIKSASHDLTVRTRTPVALYCLNQKRSHLVELERRFGVLIEFEADDTIAGQVQHAIEKGGPAKGPVARIAPAPIQPDAIEPEDEVAEEVEAEIEAEETEETETERAADAGREGNGRRRRRRRRRGRNGDEAQGETQAEAGSARQPAGEDDDGEGEDAEEAREGAEADDANGDERRRRRRRGRRGGRRGRRDREALPGEEAEDEAGNGEAMLEPATPLELIPPLVGAEPAAVPVAAEPAPVEPAAQADAPAAEAPPAQSPQLEAPRVEAPEIAAEPAEPEVSKPRGEPVHQVLTPSDDNPNRPKRTGWWARRTG
jgi:ribonuclease E